VGRKRLGVEDRVSVYSFRGPHPSYYSFLPGDEWGLGSRHKKANVTAYSCPSWEG